MGACLLWAAADTVQSLGPELPEQAFELREASVQLAASQYAGDLAPRPGVVDLATFQAFSPLEPAAPVSGALRVRATVPAGGQLLLSLGGRLDRAGPQAPQGRGPSPEMGRVGPAGPPGPPARLSGGGNQGNQGAAPGVAQPGRSPQLPGQVTGAVTLRVDRSSRMGLSVSGMDCTGQAEPGRELDLRVVFDPQSLSVWSGSERWLSCQGQVPAGRVVVGSGVQRIQVHQFGVSWAEQSRDWSFSPGPWRWLGAALGGLFGGLVLSSRARVVWGLPALAYPVLSIWDGGPWLEALRLLSTPQALAPWLILGPLLLFGLYLTLAKRLPWWAMAIAGAVPALLVLMAGLISPAGLAGRVLLAGVALPLAGLTWVNRNPVSRRPLWSYGALGMCILLGESGARMHVGLQSWVRSAGWDRAATEFEELLELQQYRRYPSEGFPVRPPERVATRKRIVALGSSSTGGAYQMDNLDLFWPNRLEQRLPQGWEVVNQGVGGWNTLHMTLYAEGQMARLAPDIVVLYVGHNDVLTPASVPHSQLYAQYRPPSPAVAKISEVLHSSRLFNGFKFAVLSVFSQGGAVAVPVADARQNLERIVAASQEQGARVLLVTEGLNPDPAPMRAYNQMLSELAAETGSVHLDGASLLYESGDPTLFLDDCHLSVNGHWWLADALEQTLREAAWIP